MMDDSAAAKSRKGSAAIKVVTKAKKDLRRFGYTFTSVLGTLLPRSYSKPKSSPSLSRSMSEMDTVVHQELHNLNTKTLQYIQQRFGLVASLLQLLCQVENDEPKPPPAAAEATEEIKPTKTPSLFKSSKNQTPTKEPKGKSTSEVSVLKKRKKWSDSYAELLECFNQYAPLKAYIESRVSPFEEILYFHPLEKRVGQQSVNKSGHHPSIADIGLASARSKVLYSATSYGLQKHARNRKFQKALEILSSEPLANCTEDSFLVSLKQTILRIIYLSLLAEENAPNQLSLLARLDDHDLCARLALQSLRHWPITTCIDVLSMCGGRLPVGSALLNVVNRELKKMKIYSEVCQTCMCVLSKLLLLF